MSAAAAVVAIRRFAGGGVHGFTPAMDVQIETAYRDYLRKGGRSAIVDCSKALRVPLWKIHRRAQFLGLARAKETPWSEEELRIVRENRFYSPVEIRKRLKAAGFVRSDLGIVLKRKRLHLTTRNYEDGYTGRALANLLNVDSHIVGRWITNGLLAAELRMTLRTPQQHGDGHWIRRQDFRAFVFAYPEEIDLRKVDAVWFIELLRPEQLDQTFDEELVLP
jgi:hypothetical protein